MTDVVVNYWAVVVCAIANMALGFAWYGPVFGKQWVGLMGWSQEHMAVGKVKMEKEGWKTYLLAFVSSLATAYVLSHVLVFAGSYLGTSGLEVGLTTGFWMWLGFVAPVTLSSVLWEGRSWKLWGLTSGYYLVSLLVMGVILALWV